MVDAAVDATHSERIGEFCLLEVVSEWIILVLWLLLLLRVEDGSGDSRRFER